MYLIISNSSDKPIYEQIAEQLKEKIITGELVHEELLPSIRALAKDLKISVITTKKAYEELERDGYIETIPGKGCFVASANKEFMKEEMLGKIEQHLRIATNFAKMINWNETEMISTIHYLYQEEQE